MQAQVSSNAQQLNSFLSRVKREQLPFAMSKAVNGMAFEAKEQEQNKLDRYFDMRTGWLRKKGAMPIVRSSKRQFPDVHAILGVKDEVAAKNVTGEDRRATGEQLAVPISDITRPDIGTPKGTLPPSKFPGRLVKDDKGSRSKSRRRKKPKAFFMTGSGGTEMVAIRKGKDRLPIKPLYVFKSEVDIKEKWPLVDNVNRMVAQDYEQRFNRELEKAMASAKRKS